MTGAAGGNSEATRASQDTLFCVSRSPRLLPTAMGCSISAEACAESSESSNNSDLRTPSARPGPLSGDT